MTARRPDPYEGPAALPGPGGRARDRRVEILTFPERDTPPALRRQVVESREQAWPRERPADPAQDGQAQDEQAQDPALRPLSMLLVEDGRVLASLDVPRKDLRHAGRWFAAGGLSAVVTRRGVRGRGHGGLLVAAARETMAAEGLDVAVFTCDRPLRGFYARAGFRPLPGAVLVGGNAEEPFPSDLPGFDKVVMADFLTPTGRRWRHTFPHSRIALHPGRPRSLW